MVTSVNPHTGKLIKVGSDGYKDAYQSGWDRIFGGSTVPAQEQKAVALAEKRQAYFLKSIVHEQSYGSMVAGYLAFVDQEAAVSFKQRCEAEANTVVLSPSHHNELEEVGFSEISESSWHSLISGESPYLEFNTLKVAAR